MMSRRTAGRLAVGLTLLTTLGCRGGAVVPATLDPKNDACSHCRMAVSDQGFAGQLVAPGEEPKFFDDIGCLRDYLSGSATLSRGATAYVADHRTRDWVRAAKAVYVRVDTLDTPMGSHIIAHADEASRQADPAARGGVPLAPAGVFGSAGPPDGMP